MKYITQSDKSYQCVLGFNTSWFRMVHSWLIPSIFYFHWKYFFRFQQKIWVKLTISLNLLCIRVALKFPLPLLPYNRNHICSIDRYCFVFILISSSWAKRYLCMINIISQVCWDVGCKLIYFQRWFPLTPVTSVGEINNY